MVDDAIAGYAELVMPSPETVEIAYFGLLPRFVGQGFGAWWLEYVVALAWQQPGATRVTLHTCELDHPSALPNYLARGFVVERTETEWRFVDG
jgi:GNAT superfamily N-acetyltransferase